MTRAKGEKAHGHQRLRHFTSELAREISDGGPLLNSAESQGPFPRTQSLEKHLTLRKRLLRKVTIVADLKSAQCPASHHIPALADKTLAGLC